MVTSIEVTVGAHCRLARQRDLNACKTIVSTISQARLLGMDKGGVQYLIYL